MQISLEPKVTPRQELIVPYDFYTVARMSEVEIKRAFASRLNAICDDKRVPPKGQNRQAEVARIFGVSQKGARKWLEGEGLPTLERAIEMALWADVSVEWLLTGRGERHAPASALDNYSQTMLAVMEKLPPYLKATALDQVKALERLDTTSSKK